MQLLVFSFIALVCPCCDYWQHAPVRLDNLLQAARRCYGQYQLFPLHLHLLPVMFGDFDDRAYRHFDAIMFLQFFGDLSKRMVGSEIGHYALQWH